MKTSPEKQRALAPPVGTVNVPNYYWTAIKRSIYELLKLNELDELEWRASRLSVKHRVEELSEYVKSVETLK